MGFFAFFLYFFPPNGQMFQSEPAALALGARRCFPGSLAWRGARTGAEPGSHRRGGSSPARGADSSGAGSFIKQTKAVPSLTTRAWVALDLAELN